MGYDWYDKLVHVPYGTVSINGEKLATRTGNVILLKDLFAEAIARVKEIAKEKHPDEAEKFKGILYSSPMYTYVSMREGEMRIMTVRSDKNVAVDTLIIKK